MVRGLEMDPIRLGERVLVRGPLDMLEEGVVEDFYENGDGLQVVVWIQEAPPEPGEDYSVLRTVDAEQVLPFTEQPPPTPLPLEQQTYRQRLRASLERVVPRLPGQPRLESFVQGYLGPKHDAVTDFVLHSPSGPLLVQADPADDGLEVDEWTVRLLVRMVMLSEAPGGVFATPDGLTEGAKRLLHENGLSWVMWRGPDDDQQLVEALTPLLERLARPATG